MPPHRFPPLILVGVLAIVTGCNTSRYGARYDECLPQIKAVAVVPLEIQVLSLHTGGAQEPRPDITAEVHARLLEELQKLVTKREYSASVYSRGTDEQAEPEAIPQAVALARAVGEAIATHHYVHGRERVFDHGLGECITELADQPSDAILMVNLAAFVPTAGRTGLAVTAVVIGVVAGVYVHVPTSGAALTLMLVDSRSGDVLWYNQAAGEVDVRSKSGLRRLVKRAAAYLLKPRKK